MKALKDLSDKASEYLDKKGLANPAEVLNEALGGETREESKKRREEAKELKDRESIRVDTSPRYSDSQMASTRKMLEGQAKAFKQERDKASEDYDKAVNKIKERNKQAKKDSRSGSMTMDEMGNSYKKGGMIGSASKRADGCAVKGKTKGRMV
jgi:hypothetical protein